MRSYALVFAALAAFSCTGESAPVEMTNAERGQVQAEVLTWADQWLDAVSNLDPQGVASLLDQADGHFFNGTSYRSNWQAFLNGTQELYSGWDAWEGEWGARRVDVLSPDAALLVGEARGMVRFLDGTEADNHVAWSFVLRRSDTGWKALFGHVTGSTTPRE